MLRFSTRFNVALWLWLAACPGIRPARALLALNASVWLVWPGSAPTTLGGQRQRKRSRAPGRWSGLPLLLDEPTASLDPHAKREVEALVAEYPAWLPAAASHRHAGFASHNLGQVKRLATRVAYLRAKGAGRPAGTGFFQRCAARGELSGGAGLCQRRIGMSLVGFKIATTRRGWGPSALALAALCSSLPLAVRKASNPRAPASSWLPLPLDR